MNTIRYIVYTIAGIIVFLLVMVIVALHAASQYLPGMQ